MINALRPGAKYPNPLMNRTPLTPRSMQVRPPIAAPMSVEQRQAPDLSLARPNAAGIIKKRKVDPSDESDAAPVEDDGCVRPKRRKNTGSFHADEEEDGEGYYFHDEDNVTESFYLLTLEGELVHKWFSVHNRLRRMMTMREMMTTMKTAKK
jgi:hypothetical protein